jgi:hypothetical protein
MQQWEYKIFIKGYKYIGASWEHDKHDGRSMEELANDLGKEGWEFACLAAPNSPAGTASQLYCVFKRPRVV